jgi:hypothetical protein
MLPLRRAPPLTTPPSYALHVVKNLGFLLLSLVSLPLSATITFLALAKNVLNPVEKVVLKPQDRLTVMVSGVRATKGLMLAREFARYIRSLVSIRHHLIIDITQSRTSSCSRRGSIPMVLLR